ncbi:Peptidase family S41 [compost metagenome]
MEGKAIAQIIKENAKYVEGSNFSAVLKNFYWVIFNGNSNTVEIEFIRDGKTAVKSIYRYLYQDLKIQFPEKEKWKLLENNVGYVDMGELEVDDVPTMMKQFQNVKAIIFDIRNRPNNTHLVIPEYLNPEPKEFAWFVDSDLSFPGRYIWRNEIQKCGKSNPDYYKGKVILLVDEGTISHGEYTTMSLQTAPQATIIGSHTSGADGGNYRFAIIKGFSSSFTSYGVFYPNKKET